MTAVLPLSGPDRASTASEPSRRAMEQAAEWYALLRSGEATDDDRALWEAWLDGDPDHRRAWRYVEAVSRGFEPLRATPDPRCTADNLWAAHARTLQRRRLLACVAVLAGTGSLGWIAWRHTPLPAAALAWTADHHTATGEVREVVLADGTRVWLDTGSAFDEDYRPHYRRLRLLAGAILVDTAGDPRRPFFVDTPQGRLRALGTRFTVRLGSEETFLAVYAGAVEVSTGSGARSVVRAGQQTRFTVDAVAAAEPADAAREAWSRGVLVARDMSLGEVVQELRRYRSGHLGVAPEVAGLRVFGSFPLRNTDDALDMLASALPIRLRRTLPWWVGIEPADRAAQ
ncbi:MAG: iron dicitrate transport regulator FecR [Burkholderiales bacterium 70-64]|nr:MAG: iron dicitrate transport regulator FecR [Burkholderiales bacterium 70-64]